MDSSRGASRLLLLGIVAAVAAIVATAVLVVFGGGSGDDDLPEFHDDVVEMVVPGRGGRDRTDVDGGVGIEHEDDGILVPFGSRTPHGEVFVVNAESLRAALAAHHWEEIRRQIDVLQQNGQPIPSDVVDNLISLLEAPETRIDAVLSLGGITGEDAGRILGAHASNEAHSLDSRLAALDALARSGNAGSRTQLIALLSVEELDPRIVRHGAFALGAVGGDGAARALTDLMIRLGPEHRERDAVVTALGKSPGSGRVLADTLRGARDAGDAMLTRQILKIALLHGSAAEAELRLAIRQLIDDTTALEGIESESERLRLRGSALAAAAAMGGELLAPVLRVAESDDAGLGGVALHSLRAARGDEAAVQIDEAARRAADPKVRRELVTALGETRSSRATGTLISMLDDSSENVRRAAARGLTLVRDPSSVKPILDRLGTAKGDYNLTRSFIDALGRIGAREALPKLESMWKSDDAEWVQVQPFVRQAIHRIESGNPDSSRMK